MGIGLGIVFLLVGLVLAFDVVNINAVNDVVDTGTLGTILIVVGVLAIILSLVINAQRARSTRVVEDRRADPRL